MIVKIVDWCHTLPKNKYLEAGESGRPKELNKQQVSEEGWMGAQDERKNKWLKLIRSLVI